ncbi:unnamed protein product [Caenorhabditis bovis]|uniref:C2H2-type domain-containing protein n=1 Tax=Caenorhabditis bovis TaxID=2654633 RepID=A0A8S1FFK4_9PELO|nr:unnamed protein product [Caenorhabditis bovis]
MSLDSVNDEIEVIASDEVLGSSATNDNFKEFEELEEDDWTSSQNEPSTSISAKYVREEPEKSVDFKRVKKRGNNRPKTISTCEICGIVLKYPSKIREHMRTHTGEKPFRCDICGLCFSQRSPMINHFRKHMGDFPYQCSFGCGKRFVNNARKNAHELRHIGLTRQGPPRPHLKPPRRLICPNLVPDEPRDPNLPNSAVANFEDIVITDELERQEAESISSKKPENSETKRDRLVETNKRIDEVIDSVLSKCLLTAPSVDEKKHEMLKRPYLARRPTTIAQCKICGIMIKHPSKIQAHVRTHTGEKPYQCGECGLFLTKSTSLKIHIRRKHTLEKPFECEWECGMSFVSEACRNEHQKIVHSGYKRYECLLDGCRETFSRRSYLMRHRANVHGEVFTQIFDPEEVAEQEAADLVGEQMPPSIIMLENDGKPAFGELMEILQPNDEYDEEEFVEAENLNYSALDPK